MTNRATETKPSSRGVDHSSELDPVLRRPELFGESDSFKDGVEEAKKLAEEFRKALGKKKLGNTQC